MQSVHAGAVQTHFFIFTLLLKSSSQQTSFWAHFRSDFRHKSQFWLKKGLQTNVQKKGAPPYANSSLWPWPGAPWQPPSRARFSEQETAVWAARNKSSCSFLSPFLSPCPGMGYFWVNFWKLLIFWWNLKQKKTNNCRSFFSYCLFPKACDLTRSGPRPGEFLLQLFFLFSLTKRLMI